MYQYLSTVEFFSSFRVVMTSLAFYRIHHFSSLEGPIAGLLPYRSLSLQYGLPHGHIIVGPIWSSIGHTIATHFMVSSIQSNTVIAIFLAVKHLRCCSSKLSTMKLPFLLSSDRSNIFLLQICSMLSLFQLVKTRSNTVVSLVLV